jgi:hypothetical protein
VVKLVKDYDLPGDEMAKYKRYDYYQKVFIPVSLEDQLMPGTLEFVIHTLVENRIDMSVFDQSGNGNRKLTHRGNRNLTHPLVYKKFPDL